MSRLTNNFNDAMVRAAKAKNFSWEKPIPLYQKRPKLALSFIAGFFMSFFYDRDGWAAQAGRFFWCDIGFPFVPDRQKNQFGFGFIKTKRSQMT